MTWRRGRARSVAQMTTKEKETKTPARPDAPSGSAARSRTTPAAVWTRLTGRGGLVREGRLGGLHPGDRYRLTLASGDTVEGEVLINRPPTDFAGTVDNWNDGLLRIGFETGMAQPEAHLWLSTWNVPQAKVDEARDRWETMLDAAARA